MTQTKLAGQGSMVSVRSGKYAGTTGRVIRFHTKWSDTFYDRKLGRDAVKVLWSRALLETTAGEVWVAARYLQVM